ncbi:MAG: aminoacyl-tRNA hydrolase [Candidatus Omnitrophota bacterium]
MKLIVGLGNPGLKYKNTRHNVGYRVAEKLALELNAKLNQKKFHSLFGEKVLSGRKLLIAKPLTYMNLSGEAVSALLNAKKIAPAEMLILCDDTNLPLGELRIRNKGSSGGHNGLKSVIDKLETLDFARLRLGIGPKPANKILTDFVLEKFNKNEERAIQKAVIEATGVARAWLLGDNIQDKKE